MHIVDRYHCDFCTKTLANSTSMAHHERNCTRNPNQKACATCEHLERVIHFTVRGEIFPAPHCAKNKMIPDPKSKTNPFGMRVNCPFHVLKKMEA